jgi:hypothetical protein
MIKIAIVNRYFPPSKASTGDLAREIAEKMVQLFPKDQVIIIATDAEYKGGWSDGKTIPTEVQRISSYYDGSSQALRFISGLIEGRTLAKKAFQEADIVLSMTNPPLVNLWMGREAKKTKKLFIEWTLDLYPLALHTSNNLSSKHPIYKWFESQVALNPPDYHLYLGEGQRQKVEETLGYTRPYSIYPCGYKKVETSNEKPSWKQASRKDDIWIGYVGNIGEAHSLDALARFGSNLPRHFHLVFSSYGAKSMLLKKELEGSPNIHWVDAIPDHELPHFDLQLVSLLPSWTHVSVPSKAISSISMGIPIIFIGEEDSDTWQMFSDAGWHLHEDFSPQDLESLFGDLTLDIIQEKQDCASLLSKSIENQIKGSITQVKTFIEGYRKTL